MEDRDVKLVEKILSLKKVIVFCEVQDIADFVGMCSDFGGKEKLDS